MVDLVGARTDLRRAGIALDRASARSTTSARRRSASTPTRGLYHCFGCGVGGDAIGFVQETEGLDFVEARRVARRALRRRAQARGRGPAPRRSAASAASGCSQLLERTTALLRALPVGVRRGARRARVPGRAAGWPRRRCARYRVGYAPSALGQAADRRAARRLLRRGDGRGRARAAKRSGSRAARTTASASGSCSRSPTRAGGCSASARARCAPTSRPKYLNTSENEIYHKGRQLFGIDQARAAAAQARRDGGRRGLHRRARAAPGGDRRTVGDHGHGADRASSSASWPRWRGRVAARARRRQRRARRRCCAPRALAEQRDARAARRRSCPTGVDPAELVAAEGAEAIVGRLDRRAVGRRVRRPSACSPTAAARHPRGPRPRARPGPRADRRDAAPRVPVATISSSWSPTASTSGRLRRQRGGDAPRRPPAGGSRAIGPLRVGDPGPSWAGDPGPERSPSGPSAPQRARSAGPGSAALEAERIFLALCLASRRARPRPSRAARRPSTYRQRFCGASARTSSSTSTTRLPTSIPEDAESRRARRRHRAARRRGRAGRRAAAADELPRSSSSRRIERAIRHARQDGDFARPERACRSPAAGSARHGCGHGRGDVTPADTSQPDHEADEPGTRPS